MKNFLECFQIFTLKDDEKYKSIENYEQKNINDEFSYEAEETFEDALNEETTPDSEQNTDDSSNTESDQDSTTDDAGDGDDLDEDFGDFDGEGGSDDEEGEGSEEEGSEDSGDGDDTSSDSGSTDESNAKVNTTANPFAVINGRSQILTWMSELSSDISSKIDELGKNNFVRQTDEYKKLTELVKLIDDAKNNVHISTNEESSLRYYMYMEQYSNIISSLVKKTSKEKQNHGEE